MLKWLEYASLLLRNCFVSRCNLALENLAFRSQLAIFEHQVTLGKRPKPKPTPAFRQLWMILSKAFMGWRSVLVVVKPETVVHWHKQGFKLFWKRKSRRKNGRPNVSTEMRRLIRKINAENPLWSPERIYDQLIDLGFSPPSPNTIRKYLPKPSRDTTKFSKSWKTFIKNHMDVTCTADFFVVPTLTFRLIYVFIIVSHERREIIHFGVTMHPTTLWVMQQLREATAFGIQPKYLIRDNDSIYGRGVSEFLERCQIEEVRTS